MALVNTKCSIDVDVIITTAILITIKFIKQSKCVIKYFTVCSA